MGTNTMPTIALFGASGQIGIAILNALLTDSSLNIIQILAPGSSSKIPESQHPNLSTKTIDLTSAKRDSLAKDLAGVDVVVSALSGKALEAQSIIQDAAADVGVRRFYPSEYGSHHVYRRPGDTYGYIHPMWNIKEQCNEEVLHHPAIASGKMTYTLIGCGDFYNQPREKAWCPWTQASPENNEYTIHIIGSPDAAADFTHTEDFAAFLLETIRHPEVSENKRLNFVSDHKSYEHCETVRKVLWEESEKERTPIGNHAQSIAGSQGSAQGT